MILIYGATLDTRILLFFQAIYMIPMFLLGVLVFFGIDRESFNLVLYPTLMLIFLILIRYGSEAALLVIHCEEHKYEQTPELVFTLVQDMLFIGLLLLYIYVCLAFTPIKPTPLELLEGGNAALASAAAAQGKTIPVQAPPAQQQQPPEVVPSTSQQQPSPAQLQLPQTNLSVAAALPDSHGFNYVLRRNIGQIPKDSIDKAMLDDIERQRQRNSLILREKDIEQGKLAGSSTTGVIETDLDAVPVAATIIQESTRRMMEQPQPVAPPVVEDPPASKTPPVKQTKSMIRAAREAALAAVAANSKKEPENKAEPEPEVDFWGNTNGETNNDAASKPEGFKTTSV